MNPKCLFLSNFVLFLILSSFFACSPKGEKTTDKPTFDSLTLIMAQEEIDGAQADIDAIWALMEQKDMDKMNVLDTLLAQIARGKTYDKVLLDSIGLLKKDLLSKRFTSEEMAVSSKIDIYDQAMARLLDSTKRLLESTKKSCSPCEAMYQYIFELDQRDLERRQKYDGLVNDYNMYLEKKKGELEALGGKYATLKPIAKFTIMEN